MDHRPSGTIPGPGLTEQKLKLKEKKLNPSGKTVNGGNIENLAKFTLCRRNLSLVNFKEKRSSPVLSGD